MVKRVGCPHESGMLWSVSKARRRTGYDCQTAVSQTMFGVRQTECGRQRSSCTEEMLKRWNDEEFFFRETFFI